MAFPAINPQVASAAIGGITSVLGNLFGINAQDKNREMQIQEAQKNRDFQEKMYYQQLKDNIGIWKMQAAYDLPSAQVQRLRDAGLNPMLMYGQGGTSLTSQSAPQSASAPSGSQANLSYDSSHFAHIANAAMMMAQIKALNAQSEKTEQESQNLETENQQKRLDFQFSQETYNIRKAIQYHNADLLRTSMDKMRQEIYNSSQITTQQILTYMQGRQYEIKRYNLSSYQVGQSVLQGWEQVKSGRIQANASFKSSVAAMQDAVTRARIAPYQIGLLVQNTRLLTEQARLTGHQADYAPLSLAEGIASTRLTNENYVLDSWLKSATLTTKQQEILKNQIGLFYGEQGINFEHMNIIDKFIAPFAVDFKTDPYKLYK